LIPFGGWAMGAGLGALIGHLREDSSDQAFQQQVRDHQEALQSPSTTAGA
jgi:uncharacterized membrane protein